MGPSVFCRGNTLILSKYEEPTIFSQINSADYVSASGYSFDSYNIDLPLVKYWTFVSE